MKVTGKPQMCSDELKKRSRLYECSLQTPELTFEVVEGNLRRWGLAAGYGLLGVGLLDYLFSLICCEVASLCHTFLTP